MTSSSSLPASTFDGEVGILQPGQMGGAMAVLLDAPLWASEGRSAATVQRASDAGMTDCGGLDGLVERADLIVSVCPPHAALTVATEVSRLGFDGLYVDANAIAPATSRKIGVLFERFVDGGIVGPPPHRPGSTRLYLSGAEAPTAATIWANTNLDAVVVDDAIGSASAVKMAYAAWTKGSAALLVNVLALAAAEGVGPVLENEWALSQPALAERVQRTAAAVGPKAWRWAGEMDEIAASFATNELPDGFHRASADLYRLLHDFKDATGATIDDLIAALLR